jgi:hypothetical protein
VFHIGEPPYGSNFRLRQPNGQRIGSIEWRAVFAPECASALRFVHARLLGVTRSVSNRISTGSGARKMSSTGQCASTTSFSFARSAAGAVLFRLKRKFFGPFFLNFVDDSFGACGHEQNAFLVRLSPATGRPHGAAPSFGHQCGPHPTSPALFCGAKRIGILARGGRTYESDTCCERRFSRALVLTVQVGKRKRDRKRRPHLRHRSPASCPGRGPVHAPGLAGCRLGNAGLESALPSGAVSGRRSYH